MINLETKIFFNINMIDLCNYIIIFFLLSTVLNILYTIFKKQRYFIYLIFILTILLFIITYIMQFYVTESSVFYFYFVYVSFWLLYLISNFYLQMKSLISKSSFILCMRIKIFTITLFIFLNDLFFNIEIAFIGIPLILISIVGLIISLIINKNKNKTEQLNNFLLQSKQDLFLFFFYVLSKIKINNLRFFLFIVWILFHIYCLFFILHYYLLFIPICILTLYYYIPALFARDKYMLNYTLLGIIKESTSHIYKFNKTKINLVDLGTGGTTTGGTTTGGTNIDGTNTGGTNTGSNPTSGNNNRMVANAATMGRNIFHATEISGFGSQTISMPASSPVNEFSLTENLRNHMEELHMSRNRVEAQLLNSQLTDTERLSLERTVNELEAEIRSTRKTRTSVIDIHTKHLMAESSINLQQKQYEYTLTRQIVNIKVANMGILRPVLFFVGGSAIVGYLFKDDIMNKINEVLADKSTSTNPVNDEVEGNNVGSTPINSVNDEVGGNNVGSTSTNPVNDEVEDNNVGSICTHIVNDYNELW